ncbi:hypothetical protein R3Q06_36275, partial [Rhodococcus erythropolis]|uniref:hypothetical protein n=1 Tax=Rhodococcus erythropolis TaxID=1833 RepID=UPI002948CFD0
RRPLTLAIGSAHVMTTSTKKSRLHRLRKLAYAPLVVAVAAGAICTGAGTGTAAQRAGADAPQSENAYTWALYNSTGEPIYGNWNAEMSTGYHSRVETSADHPWQPGDDAAEATQHQDTWRNTTWTGHICYNKHWWDFSYSAKRFGDGYFGLGIPDFRLEADSAGALFVHPNTGHFTRRALTLRSDVC